MDSAKKQASLFSFFQKTPKPKAGPNGDSPRSEQKHKKPEDEAKKPGEKAKKPEGLGAGGREAGSLVWARLEGFPYWPAMVVPHPTLATSTHVRPVRRERSNVFLLEPQNTVKSRRLKTPLASAFVSDSQQWLRTL